MPTSSISCRARKRSTSSQATTTRYSNTGFNLAAIIVARVSGMSFAEFSKQRIFVPLGMTKTSWRDDHTRIVKGRAIAYQEEGGEFHIEMPFENVHGNGGLLTTVGDLLTWNENFVNPKVGSAKLLGEMSSVGKFNDGKPQAYGLGLMVGELSRCEERIAQRVDGRISRASQPLPRVAHFGRRSLQRLVR